jgi:hypothetical protein
LANFVIDLYKSSADETIKDEDIPADPKKIWSLFLEHAKKANLQNVAKFLKIKNIQTE